MIDILWRAFADAHIKGAQGVHDDHAKLVDWKAEAAPIAAECRNQVIRELIEKAESDEAVYAIPLPTPKGYDPMFVPTVNGPLSDWLKSQMEGE